MKRQLTLAANEFERFRKPTRREMFLAEMNSVVPWAELVRLLEPHYPKTTSVGGRPPAGLERMLRIHCLQLWFNLSDPAVEEALYDSLAIRSLTEHFETTPFEDQFFFIDACRNIPWKFRSRCTLLLLSEKLRRNFH